jgi:hypothetical protein
LKMRKTSYHLGIVLIIVLVFWSGPSLAREESSRDLYFRAEGAYKNLINAPSRQKLRHYWLRVIEKFEAVYKRDPDGEWASASLYRAGVIWLELSRFSGRQADREIGVERLQNVVTQFPRSAVNWAQPFPKPAYNPIRNPAGTSRRPSAAGASFPRIPGAPSIGMCGWNASIDTKWPIRPIPTVRPPPSAFCKQGCSTSNSAVIRAVPTTGKMESGSCRAS